MRVALNSRIPTYFNFGDFSSSYKNDFRNNAIMYAGVNWDNKDDRFAANVGNYNSIYEDSIIL